MIRVFFTVTQLSYTFQPRRRIRKSTIKQKPYYHALKALAIRESKIYILGRSELDLKSNIIFWDVEGVPDRDFYYLIGLLIKNRSSCIQKSFWAENELDEN